MMALIGASAALPFYNSLHGVPGALHYNPNNMGNRYGSGYVGNPGIGIKQTDANLADLYVLPRQLAQQPAPRPLNAVAPVTPYSPLSAMQLAPAPENAGPFQYNPINANGFYHQAAAAALNFGNFL